MLLFKCREKEVQVMNNELIQYLLSPVVQIALIVGLAEIVKGFGIEKRWIPVVDVCFGLLSGIFVYHFIFENGIIQSIVLGIALGLSACGLFSGIKNVLGK